MPLQHQAIIFISLLLLSSPAFSQQKKIATIDIANVQSVYVDRPGDLYVLQHNNTLQKFDTLGLLLLEKKFEHFPTTFDPRDGARMFYYSNKEQRCSFFSPETKQDFIIEQHYAIEPTLACSSGDHNVWVLDNADLSLKKISPSQSTVLAEVSLSSHLFNKDSEILMMREYQNFLFVLEKQIGLVVFNGLGKRINIIKEPNLTYFNFIGEELYYKKNNTLVFYDLFDTSTREVPIDADCRFALLTDLRTYLVYENRIEILGKL